MGKYLDALQNFTIEPYNFSYTFQNDTITEAIEVTNQQTKNTFGSGILAFMWFTIFIHLAKRENGFDLTTLGALISTNALVLSSAIFFVYLGILVNIQVLIWVVLIYFLSQCWGILRTSA